MLLLVSGTEARARSADPGRLERAWLWLGLAGVAWGVAMALLWAGAHLLFGRQWPSELPLLPTAVLLMAMALGPFHDALAALSKALDGHREVHQTTVTILLLTVLTLCLLDLPSRRPDYSNWLPQWLQFIRPLPEYRALLLMPIWGVWAMMVPVHFCRLAEGACPVTVGFAHQQPVAATALWMAIPLGATLWELRFFEALVALPAVAGLVGGSLVAILLCWRSGGVSRHSLLASNLATQLIFLLGYLAGKSLLISGS